MDTQLLVICVLTFIIHLIGTLAYAARIAGVRTRRIAISFSLFNILTRHLLKSKARLEQRGVPSEGPLQLGPPRQASLYFNDPFGNHLELACLGFAHPIPVRPPVMTAVAWPQQVR